ncbi:hypothetical protein WJ04_09170 [Burkholderia vietnamiensis]|uniref:hypothetical protein n=1 Tax=Burkholderia vietnamiensis TaxID=60552 RepID=UPI000758D5F2|nr:hypothetical protein [Burkholderia vietnamiensis]KVF08990.1 hypothetical protein WJ04_09170 [Burkholderia vietnamiensis]
MARIPLGDSASVVAQPAPQVQADPNAFGAAQARAQEGLGNAGMQFAAEQIQKRQKLDDDLARTNAAVAYQSHATNVQSAMKTANEQLASGAIDQPTYEKQLADAQKQSFDSTIGALPGGHYKNIATVQSAGLDRTVTLGMQEALTKNTQQLIATNAATLLDTAGKSIATNPASIDGTVASTKQAYLTAAASAGIPQPRAAQVAQDWADSQYASHAQSAAIAARSSGDLTALTQLEKDLTSPDGYYAGKLDANKRNQVLSTVVSNRLALENQMNSEQQAREREAVTAFNQGTDLMTQGKRFSPEYVQQLTSATRGTTLEGQTQELIARAAAGAGFSTLSVPQMRAAVQANEGRQNQAGTDPIEAAAIKQQKQILTATDEAYKRDPWNAALERGAIPGVPPIDTSGVTQLASSLAARAQLAPVVEDKAGRRVSLLTPDEARSVLQTVDSLPTDTKAQALALLGRSMGNAARINDLAEQWKDKSPAAALAMKAGAADPSGGPLMMQSGMPVAQYILDGQDALTNKLVKVDAAAATGLQATIAKQIGDALPPQQLNDARETAYFAAVASARRAGRDVPNSTDILTGVNVATGGLSKTGGIDPRGNRYMAAKPWGWSDDDFDGGVKQASVSNIENQPGGRPVDSVLANGTKIPVDQFMQQFASYRLQRVGIGGTYTVLTGARPVTDATGAPLLIHLTKPVPKR